MKVSLTPNTLGRVYFCYRLGGFRSRADVTVCKVAVLCILYRWIATHAGHALVRYILIH